MRAVYNRDSCVYYVRVSMALPSTSHRPYLLYHSHVGAILSLPILCIFFFFFFYHVLPCLCYLHVIYCRAIALVANVTC